VTFSQGKVKVKGDFTYLQYLTEYSNYLSMRTLVLTSGTRYFILFGAYSMTIGRCVGKLLACALRTLCFP
jgi:hypothetical protein